MYASLDKEGTVKCLSYLQLGVFLKDTSTLQLCGINSRMYKPPKLYLVYIHPWLRSQIVCLQVRGIPLSVSLQYRMTLFYH